MALKPKPLALWTAILWAAMQKTGKGFRHHSLKNTGEGLDRRNDKLGEARVLGDDGKHTTIYLPLNECKCERAMRLGNFGVRK